MKDSEYILVKNLARLEAAESVLNHAVFDVGTARRVAVSKILQKLQNLISSIYVEIGAMEEE